MGKGKERNHRNNKKARTTGWGERKKEGNEIEREKRIDRNERLARGIGGKSEVRGWRGGRRAVCIERKKHKNAYYRFRNTAISLKSARLSFIKRKQILMYFYTPAAVFVAPTPPPPPPPPPTPPTPATAGAVRGVEAKSNYFYSGEMSAAKSLILINGAGTRSPLPLSFSSPPFDTHHSTAYHSSPHPPSHLCPTSPPTPRSGLVCARATPLGPRLARARGFHTNYP